MSNNESQSVQLTYIPAEYWSELEENVHYKIMTKGAKPPPKSSRFFIFWIYNNTNIDLLEQSVNELFTNIPIKKLTTCKIRLALPSEKSNDSDNTSGKSNNSNFPLEANFVVGKIVPIPPLIKIFFDAKIDNEYSDSISTWMNLTKFTTEMLSRGNFIPILEQKRMGQDALNTNYPTQEVIQTYPSSWHIILKSLNDYDRFNLIVENSPWVSYNIPINFNKDYTTEGIWEASYIFTKYMNSIGDFIIRSSLSKKFKEKIANIYGYRQINDFSQANSTGELIWGGRFLYSLITENDFSIFDFSETTIPDIINNWTRGIDGFPMELGFIFTLKLVLPQSAEEDWKIEFFLKPLTMKDDEVLISLEKFWQNEEETMEQSGNYCSDMDELEFELYKALGIAARYFPPINRALEQKYPHEVLLSSTEVMDFIKKSMYVLIQAGYHVELPSQFKNQGQQRLNARMRLGFKEEKKTKSSRTKGGSVTKPAVFGMDSMLEYNWEVEISGKKLTNEEFLQLAKANEPLIFWRGNWILLDPNDMGLIKPIFENKGDKEELKQSGEIAYYDALKYGIIGQTRINKENESETAFEVVLDGDFQDIIDLLIGKKEFREISQPKSFIGKLRPYQQTALKWLGNMAEYGLGVCLADDMGLGKTIEVISFLLDRYERKDILQDGSILIVCPTSLIFNWQRELHKFAPDLDVLIHHGQFRTRDAKALMTYTQKNKIIITTYGTIRNDIEFLEPIPFTGIIIDESQNIKNYDTLQTKSMLKLRGQFKIALSGTPIENKLVELWSLFEFLNPGLLGTRLEFKKRFINPIENFHDTQKMEQLQKMLSPFIMRRVKTDKTIITDLPPKNEINVQVGLSEEQKILYQKVVDDTLAEIESSADGRTRKGLILKLLTYVKQICNHPVQYTLDADDKNIEEKLEEIDIKQLQKSSMKLKRLIEKATDVIENGEKILIFSQYTQMGKILKNILERVLGYNVLFFHGGLNKNKRAEIIDKFQLTPLSKNKNIQYPILILSLKAGGTGLNLTEASTVFHYDRWWNPAVEDQATDRAYRIGQKNRVNVYKFISEGTIEEKINLILEEKRNLADSILKSKDETFITSLSNEEIRDLFSLNERSDEGL